MKLTRFGLQIRRFRWTGAHPDELFERTAALASTAEACRFDSVWVMDHLHQVQHIGERDEPMLEAFTLLAALATRTERVQLGTLVAGVTHRNPALVAKQVMTLDAISRGRAILGIGAAWNEAEHRRFGLPFPPAEERMARLEEALEICRAMFAQPEATYLGRHHRIEGASSYPRPVRGTIPVLVGGNGERRLLRLVALHGDACNLTGDLPTIRHKLQVLDKHCREVGRDPEAITRTRVATLVVGEDAAEARQHAARLQADRAMNDEEFRAHVIAGSVDDVCEHVAACWDTGLDGIIFNLADERDVHSLHLAGRVVRACA